MSWTFPQVYSCCCGCSLKTGSLLILWLFFISGISYAVMPYQLPRNEDFRETYQVQTLRTSVYTNAPVLAIFQLIDGLLLSILSGFGLFSVYRDIPTYLLPFLIIEGILLFLPIIAYIILWDILSLIVYIIVYSFFVYFWLVLFSHYRVLKGSNKQFDEEE